MSRTESSPMAAKANQTSKIPPKTNGHVEEGDLSLILAALQSMRENDFSVRLPGS